MTVPIDVFMDRLGQISEYEGVDFARAHRLFDAEETYSNEVLKYKGYLALSDAFKCFFLETVEIINVEIRPKIEKPLSEFYAIFVPRMSNSFTSLCGTERVSIRGYPLQGYTLLRNIFDNLVLTSAALQGMTDFYSIEGIVPGKPVDPVEVNRLRKNTEYAVRKQMTGTQSGLSDTTLKELAKWDALFDYETHGARLSASLAMDWMRGQGPLPVLTMFEEMPFSMFVNRFCEVGWILHRLIPLLQIPNLPFSNAWRRKWQIIDASFEQTVDSLTSQLGKPIGSAIIELVKSKFPFNEKSEFPL